MNKESDDQTNQDSVSHESFGVKPVSKAYIHIFVSSNVSRNE